MSAAEPRLLATAGDDETVHIAVWYRCDICCVKANHLRNLSLICAVCNPSGKVCGLVGSPNLEFPQVRLWEDCEQSGCWQHACSTAVEDPAMCVSFSPDSTLVAAGA